MCEGLSAKCAHVVVCMLLHGVQVEPFKQRDWEAKRQEKDLQEVSQAGSKLGIKAEVIRDNLQQLQALVPGLLINLDKMKASDWVRWCVLLGKAHLQLVALQFKSSWSSDPVGDTPQLAIAGAG